MPTEWFFSKSGQQLGPVSSEQLKQLADSGHLQPSDLVWRDGMGQWVEARKIKGLFPVQTTQAPLFPPPVPSLPDDLAWIESVNQSSTTHSPAATPTPGRVSSSTKAAVAAERRKSNAIQIWKMVGFVGAIAAGLIVLIAIDFFSGHDQQTPPTSQAASVANRSHRDPLDGGAPPTYTGPLPPKRDYSKGPKGEVPRPFTMCWVKDGQEVESLNGQLGTTVKGHEIVLANGNSVYHGRITWTNDIGPLDSSDLLDAAIHSFLRGTGEMYFWNGIPEGTLRQWYPDGKKWIEMTYVGGRKNGLLRMWYDNGTQKCEGLYEDDMPDGTWTTWYRDGRLGWKTPFKNGIKKSSSRWDEDGLLLYDESSSMKYQEGFDMSYQVAMVQVSALKQHTHPVVRESLMSAYRDNFYKEEEGLDRCNEGLRKWNQLNPNQPRPDLQGDVDYWEGRCDGLRKTMAKHGFDL